MNLFIVPLVLALAVIFTFYFGYKCTGFLIAWRKDASLEKMFWQRGTMRDGKWLVPVLVNMEQPRGCFYLVRIQSVFHQTRRWFVGRGSKRAIFCHLDYLKLPDLFEGKKSH